MYEVALKDLRLRWRDGQHTIEMDDIHRWAKLGSLSSEEVFDKLAVELSGDFFIGFLGWEFTDAVANHLYFVLIEMSIEDKAMKWPEEFWEFYLAFDQSEVEGPQDRELIRSFLRKHMNVTG